MKINSLTQEQIEQFPAWVDKWTKIGLSTEPIDFDKAQNTVEKIYSLIGIKPKVIIRLNSPMGTTVGGAYAVWMLNELFNKKNKVRSQVRSQVESQVWSQVRSQVWSQVWSQKIEGYNNYRGGQFWASWFAYISFFRDVCGWKDKTLDSFSLDEELGKNSGWVWWHEDVCVISDRPKAINLDKQGRLHSLNSKAIEYRDDWGIYCVNGVTVEDYVVMNPEKITVKDIEKEQNSEVKRIKIERYGQDKYLKDSNAELVSTDLYGKLWRKEIPNDEPLVMVELLNSTPEPDGHFKTYFLRVPPTVKTCHEGVSWTFGKDTMSYAPIFQS